MEYYISYNSFTDENDSIISEKLYQFIDNGYQIDVINDDDLVQNIYQFVPFFIESNMFSVSKCRINISCDKPKDEVLDIITNLFNKKGYMFRNFRMFGIDHYLMNDICFDLAIYIEPNIRAYKKIKYSKSYLNRMDMYL